MCVVAVTVARYGQTPQPQLSEWRHELHMFCCMFYSKVQPTTLAPAFEWHLELHAFVLRALCHMFYNVGESRTKYIKPQLWRGTLKLYVGVCVCVCVACSIAKYGQSKAKVQPSTLTSVLFCSSFVCCGGVG